MRIYTDGTVYIVAESAEAAAAVAARHEAAGRTWLEVSGTLETCDGEPSDRAPHAAND